MRTEQWITVSEKIMSGEGKMLSAEASHSFTISALLTHSSGKVDSVFISTCFPKCLEEEPDTYMAGKDGAALKASAAKAKTSMHFWGCCVYVSESPTLLEATQLPLGRLCPEVAG